MHLKFSLKESSGQMLVCERMLSSSLDRSWFEYHCLF